MSIHHKVFWFSNTYKRSLAICKLALLQLIDETFLSPVVAHNTSQPVSRIDDAVSRILSAKYAFSLFEKPRPSKRKWSNHSSFGSDKHREVARKSVRKSLVLLKNSDKNLPLKKSTRILVAGKNADNLGHQCGGFTVTW